MVVMMMMMMMMVVVMLFQVARNPSCFNPQMDCLKLLPTVTVMLDKDKYLKILYMFVLLRSYRVRMLCCEKDDCRKNIMVHIEEDTCYEYFDGCGEYAAGEEMPPMNTPNESHA